MKTIKQTVGFSMMVAVVMMFWAAPNARATVVILSNDFSTALGSQLEVPEGAAKFIIDGTIHRPTSGAATDRAYVRTVDSNFIGLSQWIYELSVNQPGANGTIAWMGIGEGVQSTFNEEPGTAIRLTIGANGVGRLDVSAKINNGPNLPIALATGFGTSTRGQFNRYQIARNGDILTFAFDNAYDGTFDATASTNISLTAAGVTLTSANSHLFFGDTDYTTTSIFDDLLITTELSPEPSTIMLLGLGGLLIWRRRTQNG